jgi:hypothetical protein
LTNPPVVAHVDDDPNLRAVVGVEIERETPQRAFRHVADVHVAEPAVAELLDQRAIHLDPVAIEQRPLGAAGDRLHGDCARLRAVGCG